MEYKQNILITGSSGFIGQNILSYFNNEFNCNSIIRQELKEVSPTSIKSNKAIVHLAGKAHDLKNLCKLEEYYQVNFELTKQLYDAFLKSGAEKFIFVSSIKAVVENSDEPLTEKVFPDPQTHYGKSKLMAEEYIQSLPLPAGKSYYILRPCMTHGPQNKGNLNLLYKFVKKGIPYPLAGFNNKRSFLSVENLCFVINELIVRDDIPGGIYQVADDDALSTNEVVSILASSLKVKPRLWKIPKDIIMLVAKLGDWLHLPLTTERLNKLTESYLVSNEKIKRALNKELPLSAIEGLKITADSFSKA